MIYYNIKFEEIYKRDNAPINYIIRNSSPII